MGLLDNNSTQKPLPNTNTTQQSNQFISDDEIMSWFEKAEKQKAKKVCMVLGEDGTGKTGLVLHHIAKQLREDKTARAIIVDLDGGAYPLMKHYEDISDRLIVKNPQQVKQTTNSVDLDYEATMNWIRSIANFVARKYNELNIKAFVFDGLSTLLNYAERQMRLEKNLDADGGVQMRYWLKRNKEFEETLEIIKTIPIDSYFIGHTNFILTEDAASIKIKTNAMMFQRIICERTKDSEGNFALKAKITKSKSNPLKEDTEYIFCKVKGGEVKFDSTAVFKDL